MWANSVLIALFSILVGSAPSYAQYQSIFMLPQTPTSVAIPFNNAANGTVLDFGGNGDCIPGGAGYAASYGLARDAGCAYSGLYIPPQQYVLCNALPPAIAGPNPNPGVIIFPSNGSPIVISITGYCGAPSKLDALVVDLHGLANSAWKTLALCVVASSLEPELIPYVCRGTFGIALWTYRIATDPADPNYTVVAQPVPPILTPVYVPSLTQMQLALANAALADLNSAGALAQALYTSMNRAQGALAAGDSYWMTQQTAAEAEWARELASFLAGQNYIASQLAGVLSASGLFEAISPAEFASIQEQLAQSGFPESMLEAMIEAGMTANDISAGLQIIAGIDPTTVNGSYSSVIANALQPSSASTAHELAVFAATIPTTNVPGDLNKDLVDDCADIDIVKASFGLHAGYGNFDARADANLDGVVDVRDLVIVARYLPSGTVCQ